MPPQRRSSEKVDGRLIERQQLADGGTSLMSLDFFRATNF